MLVYGRTDKMFVLTVKSKIKKPKRMLILVGLGAVLLLTILYISANRQKTTATIPQVGEYSLSFGTDSEKANFLSTFGLSGEIVTIDKVKIPSEFNPIYEKYNKLQKKMGLSLDDYKGETVKRFVYKTEDDMYVSVLCSKNYVVACHMCTDVYGDDFKALVD